MSSLVFSQFHLHIDDSLFVLSFLTWPTAWLLHDTQDYMFIAELVWTSRTLAVSMTFPSAGILWPRDDFLKHFELFGLRIGCFFFQVHRTLSNEKLICRSGYLPSVRLDSGRHSVVENVGVVVRLWPALLLPFLTVLIKAISGWLRGFYLPYSCCIKLEIDSVSPGQWWSSLSFFRRWWRSHWGCRLHQFACIQ